MKVILLIISSIVLFMGCGGSTSKRVYWPARTVFEKRNFEAPELDDKRWNDVLIIPHIIAGVTSVPSLDIAAISSHEGKSIYLVQVELFDSEDSNEPEFLFSPEKTILIDRTIYDSHFLIGSERFKFPRSTAEGRFLERSAYFIRVTFRENIDSNTTLKFDYPIVTFTENYLLPY